MSLRELTHRNIKKAPSTTPIIDIARLMQCFKIGSVFLEEGQALTGVVTESDLVRIALTGGVPFNTSVRLIMSSPIIEMDINRSVIEANHIMHFNGIRHLGISEHGRIVGLISVRDLVHYFSTCAESPLHDLGDILKPLSVLTHRDVEAVGSSISVQRAAQKMKERKIGSLFVSEEEHYTGIITEADMVRKVVSYGLDPSKIAVGVIMNTPIVDIDISRSVLEANDIMSQKKVRHLAVTEKGKIVGVLSIRDLIGMISIRDLPRFFQLKDSLA